jgi:undecaprenyl diphosphate synthase
MKDTDESPAEIFNDDAYHKMIDEAGPIPNIDYLVIPDGNRTYASQKLNKPKEEFTRKDYDFAYASLPKVINQLIYFLNLSETKRLYFWCNSINNLTKRSRDCVESYLDTYLKVLDNDDKWPYPGRIRVNLRGNLELFEEAGYPEYYDKFKKLEEDTKNNEFFDLYCFLNYTTMDDIKRAISKVPPNEDKTNFESYMDEPENIDTIIRTGGQERLSGFSPIRSPNAKIWVIPELFHQLGPDELIIAFIDHLEKITNDGK